MSISADNLMDVVGDVLREVSAEVIEPRFETLRTGDVRFKSPGEVVTVADEDAERLLKIRLGELVPDAVVIGEEEFSGGAGLSDALDADRIWLIDPLDGTANFVAGSPMWAVMVALVEGTRTSAAWIWQPVTGSMYRAELGGGAERNGSPIERQPPPISPQVLRGAVLTRFLDPATATRIERNHHRFRSVGPGTKSAGIDYPMLVDGDQDFVLFWRTLPWDHAPGALIVSEAGGSVRRLDGHPYSPKLAGEGLLAVADRSTWRSVRDGLLANLEADSGGV